MTMFRRCPREYQFAYVMRRRSATKSEALRFGSFFHIGLNAWWHAPLRDGCEAPCTPEYRLEWAFDAMHEKSAEPGEGDPFELVKAEELMIGYTARWGDEPYETIAVERQFRLPITRDTDGGAWYDHGGSIDAIARKVNPPAGDYPAINEIHNVEHKTTSQDISPGAPYWRHVRSLDSQVSTYMKAARELGYNPCDTIYDVIRKPSILPLKATPIESRKYTKPTAKDPKPRLYANMREEDETPEEYRVRLQNDIASNPDRYFQRQTIVRLEAEDEAHEQDVLQTAEMIRFAEQRHAFPRTVSACERYGRLCDYHPVCSGEANIEDSRYVTKENTHDELGDV
jgi:hypothetical protein